MCGICGIVNFSATEPVAHYVIQRMADVQSHRGPDDAGYFFDDGVGLGHRRLSIIDISGGRQPMFNEDGSVVAVFNGEIYNFAEVRAELISQGHVFKTRSDTETIVHAYEQYGDDCVQHFRGMFAFAVWDRRRRRLLIARDRLGIKPVYYYAGTRFLAFASEIKSLLQHPDVPCETDPEAVDLFLALRYVPGPGTMFRNILKLQPGHSMVVDSSGVHVRKYWDIRYTESELSEAEYVERFKELFEQSVRLRLIADVPLGVFLSGGIDSTAVLATMSRITGRRRVKTFSVGYQGSGPDDREIQEANEFAFAREAAAAFGADHHEYCVGATEFRDAIPAMVEHLDEPMADPSCIPLFFISKVAQKHITVVLSGEGADEIMAGYGLYRKVLRIEALRRHLGPAVAALPWIARFPLGERAAPYLRRAAKPFETHYRGVVKGLSVEERLELIGERRLWKSEEQLDEVFGAYFAQVQKSSVLNRMLFADAKVWLPEDLLLKADKITMAASIELRVPFLDHKLVEFAATLPARMKVRGKTGKWILREALGGELPPSILTRPKKGFPSPAGAWFRHSLRGFVRETLLSRDAACRKFFNPEGLESVVRRNEEGKCFGFQEVWSLLVFEAWHRRFMDNVRARSGQTTRIAV
jgi:asparagine synthase (glutamine-hydrolysing)